MEVAAVGCSRPRYGCGPQAEAPEMTVACYDFIDIDMTARPPIPAAAKQPESDDMSLPLENLPDDILRRLVELHSALSPEALTGDGEAPEQVWEAREHELKEELLVLQQTHGISQDDIDEVAVFRESDRRLDLTRRGQRPRVRM